MGNSMCGHILSAGYKVTIFNRTLSKTESLASKGAVVASSPIQVARQSDIVFTILSYPQDVRKVILGDNEKQEEGVLHGLQRGSLVVDMTTSSPSLAREIHQLALEKGVFSLDAPVSGGDIGARNATLSIMVGGEKEVVERVTPLFQLMGKNIVHMGPSGSGQHTKMVNQILIASNMIGVVEGLIYGHKAGLDLESVIKAVGSGAAGSWSINNLGPRILNRNFEPGFFIDHFVKDLGIALEEAKTFGLTNLPGLTLATQLYRSLQQQGYGKKGTQALQLALESLNNVTLPSPPPQS